MKNNTRLRLYKSNDMFYADVKYYANGTKYKAWSWNEDYNTAVKDAFLKVRQQQKS